MATRFVHYPVFGITHRAVKGRTPTKEEKEWMDFICQQGCIVCHNEIGVFSPCEPHHIDGKTQAGAHFLTIPLLRRGDNKYQLLVDEVLENCCKAVDFLLNSNINDTMNKYNKKNKEIN